MKAVRMIFALAVKLALLVAVGVGIHFGVGVFRERAEARIEASREEPAPLPVEARALVLEDGYTVEDRYLGRLEPAREARLAFERSGLVTAVMVGEGGRVAAGETIARLDTRTIDAERARLDAQRARVVASLELARRTLERQETLGREGHASGQRLDETRLDVTMQEASLAEIDAALERLAVDRAQTELVAPFAGTIAARDVDEGAVVSPGTPVVTLLETDAPRARIGVAPDVAARLTIGERLALVVDGVEITARVEALRPDVDGATRTVTVILALAPPVPAAFGTLVEMRRERLVPEPGFWVPLAALVEGRRGLWSVFVAVPAHGARIVRREAVEILHVADERAYVRGTLRPGSALVAGGPHRVSPGQRVVLADAE